jgi:uncharacterized membrane protein required for colicin V production
MDIGTTDVFLLVIIVSALIVGFFWGGVRSLMLLAAWLLAFLAGAYLKLELGSYLAAQWPNFTPTWSEMAAFALIYMGLLLAAPILIVILSRSGQQLTRYQVLDDGLGALLAVVVAVLGLAGLMIVFSTYYDASETFIDPQGGPDWSATMFQSLLTSNIGAWIYEHVVPPIGTLLGPILPADVREVFG